MSSASRVAMRLASALVLLCVALANAQSCPDGVTTTNNGFTLCVIDKNSGVPTTTQNNLKTTFFATYPLMRNDWNPNAPTFVTMIFDPSYSGVAYTQNAAETYGSQYYINNPADVDSCTHESFHVTQAYVGLGEQPGWLVEGLADYARNWYGINNTVSGWSLGNYQSGQSYTDGYRVTARFLIWVNARYPNVLKSFDAGMRAGTYTTSGSWPNLCGGYTVDQLWSQYIANPAIPANNMPATNADRQLALDTNNKLRAQVAQGKAINNDNKPLPQGSNIYELSWSPILESYAATIASGCSFSYSNPNNTIATTILTASQPAQCAQPGPSFNMSMYQSYGQLASSGQASLTMTGSNGNQFTLMSWAATKEVGCALQCCPTFKGYSGYTDWAYIVCSYGNTAGNVNGQSIYTTGSPASNCPSGSSPTSAGLCRVNGASTLAPSPVTTTTTPAPTTTTTAKPVAYQGASGLSDADRQTVLNAHNALRSQLAQGKAYNKNGTSLPQSANEIKVTYSKQLESYALQQVNSCQYTAAYTNNTMMNIAASASSDGKFRGVSETVNSSTYSWFGELQTNGLKQIKMDGTEYSHFTLAAWAAVQEIGCAVGYCNVLNNDQSSTYKNWTFAACSYSPAGNVYGQNMYAVGSPCSQCPSGTTCESATGLCIVNGVATIH